MIVSARFWAPYRGAIGVEVVTVPTMTADEIGRLLYDKAIATYHKHWPFPASDRKAMQIVGVTNGIETANGGLK